jgi:decaprenylphospho-beta-D-ribofuranose 2-oxidase
MNKNTLLKLVLILISFSFNFTAASTSLTILTPEEQCERLGLVDDSGSLESTVNDVSLINSTTVACIIKPETVEEVTAIVKWSYDWNKLKGSKNIGISIAGTKHSQGGHIANDGGITLDLSSLNRVYKPVQHNGVWSVKVQSGALWHQVHEVIKHHNGLAFANKVQQSSTPFSVGGSLSVNAHGRNFSYGSIIHSVQSIRVVLPSGEIVHADRTINNDIFRLAIGGYGLFGVIVEASLELVPNHYLKVDTARLETIEGYIEYISNKIKGVDRGEIIRDINGRISQERYSPISYLFATVSLDKNKFLTGVSSYIYRQEDSIDNTGELNPDPEPSFFNKAWFTKIGFGLKRKGYLVKTSQYFQHNYLLEQDTRLKMLTPPINPILAAANNKKPDLLQEYFIPVDRVPEFFASLRQVFKNNDITLSNVSLRFVPKSDDRSVLSYVSDKEDQFAVVLYFSMKLDDKSIIQATKWTHTLVQSAIALGGRHYLPYQRWPTKEQVESAYPMLKEFNELKKQFDPFQTFTNQFYKFYLSGF